MLQHIYIIRTLFMHCIKEAWHTSTKSWKKLWNWKLRYPHDSEILEVHRTEILVATKPAFTSVECNPPLCTPDLLAWKWPKEPEVVNSDRGLLRSWYHDTNFTNSNSSSAIIVTGIRVPYNIGTDQLPWLFSTVLQADARDYQSDPSNAKYSLRKEI